MSKKIIALLFGGKSAEYAVSLQSAHAVAAHLDAEKYQVVYVGVTQAGDWYRYWGEPALIQSGQWQEQGPCTPAGIFPSRQQAGLWEDLCGERAFTRLDAAFPVMHGTFGEDGTVQGLLELAGIPVVGCGTLASAVCMDKDLAHRVVQTLGIPVPAAKTFCREDAPQDISWAAGKIGYPVFVKPVAAGSSFGISRVDEPAGLAAAVENAFQYGERILVEEAVPGFEVGCAVLGNGHLTLGEPDEVELASGFFDFDEKYSLATSKIHVPARVSPETAARIKAHAADIYRVLGCRGFARVDLFLKPDGTLVFNEVNTIPGLTTHSRYPAMMRAAGLEFAQVLDKLIEMAVSA